MHTPAGRKALWKSYTSELLFLSESHPTPCNPVDYSSQASSVHRISQARILEVGCHFLLQEIFPTQGLNPNLLCLLHWQADS